MSEESGEKAAAPEVLAEARQLGWVPREEFRGDPARWTDADTFVQRGHEVMPLLKANNARLLEELTAVRGQLKEATDSISSLQVVSAEITKERVQAVKKELMAGIKTAREEGDVDREVELVDQLTELKAGERAAPKQATPTPPPSATDPALVQWMTQPENAWFGKDKRRTALAMGVAEELRNDPANAKLIGLPFYERVAAEVAQALSPPPARVDRVEGSRGGAGGSSSGSRGKGYADLPADAKAICDRQAKSFAGKPGFKDVASWNTYYARVYFGDQE